jgi:hypothetical protein
VGELGEKRWAVLSERGREASGLTYEEARKLERRLTKSGVHGLCIVTDRAASRISPPKDRKLKIED